MIAGDDYRFLADLLKRNSGLALGDGKEYLLESRLPSVAARMGFADLPSLVQGLRFRPTPDLIKAVCDAMTTGETFFFRDTVPFVALEQQLIPEMLPGARALGRPLRIWCAASSTGQEPYSIAMIVDRMRPTLAGVPVEIVATDYSSATLARARAGIYNQFEVQRGLPVQLLVKYFQQVPTGFQISAELRRMVEFRELNLLQPLTALGMFDIIFVRNVLIYFDTPTKRDVLERIARQLHPGGAVLLGGTENTLGITERLVRQEGSGVSVYRHAATLAPTVPPLGRAVA